MFASFWVDLVKLFCTLVHEVPDQVRDDGEELILRQAHDDIWKIDSRDQSIDFWF